MTWTCILAFNFLTRQLPYVEKSFMVETKASYKPKDSTFEHHKFLNLAPAIPYGHQLKVIRRLHYFPVTLDHILLMKERDKVTSCITTVANYNSLM